MNGAITTEFDPDAEPEKKAALLPQIAAYAVVDAVKTVTCREAKTYEPTEAGEWGDTPLHVALLDLGCKNNIVRCLQKRGCRVTVLPGTTTAAQLAELQPGRPDALQRPRRPGRECGDHRQHPQNAFHRHAPPSASAWATSSSPWLPAPRPAS